MARTIITTLSEGWTDASGAGYETTLVDDGDTLHLVGYLGCDNFTGKKGADVVIGNLPSGVDGDKWAVARPVLDDNAADIAGSVKVDQAGEIIFAPARNYIDERVELQIAVTWAAPA